MNREDLEHIIRAAADVTNEYEFIIVGSQSIRMVDHMHLLDDAEERSMRARIRRWVKLLRERGYDIASEH